MSRPFRAAALAISAFALAVAAGAAAAQAWPVKPIRAINPFPAGGGTDTFARPWAAKMTQLLGQQVLIENMGGAGGTVGATRASKEAPDGYTWFIGAIHHTIAETLYTKLPYSLERDFAPVTVLAAVPNVVVLHPKNDFKTLQELIAYAKANPGKLNFGSAGSGTSHHLIGELFKQTAKVDLTHVPYKGAGPMMQDLLAGQVDMAFDGMGTSANQIKAGKLRPLAVTTGTRNSVVPDVPTMKEAGVDFAVSTTWYALWGIKGTPQPVIDRMYAETVKVLQMPDIKAIWASQGADAGGQPPAEFAAFVKSEIAKWGKVVKDGGIKVDL
ncbi:MAG TPA: tripartite tricarboxylate transporter substrate binding protein [Burkholderiales bacterium]|nr:tripartite tricarboxylate transporter substrate binding protein [Burkholderiales bacterium]